MGDSVRERAEKRLAGMKLIRKPREAGWDEISTLAQPYRSRHLNGRDGKGRTEDKLNMTMRNSYGSIAFRTLKSGMYMGLSNPASPWFKLETYDTDLMNDMSVKIYLAEVEERLYGLFSRSRTFYPSLKQSYGELGLFGYNTGVLAESQGSLVTHSQTCGESWIALDENLEACALFRRIPMTAEQMRMEYTPKGEKGILPNCVEKSLQNDKPHDPYVVYNAIEKNSSVTPGKIDAKNKAWSSLHWCEEDERTDALLRHSGYEERPFYAPRWETVGSDIYGTSPGFDALADLRELQLQSKRKGEATDMSIFPPMVFPTEANTPGFSMQPRAKVFMPAGVADAVKPLYQVDYRAIAVIGEDVSRLERAVAAATYADLFMAITNMPGIQPRQMAEIAARNEEKLTQLGPVVESVNGELQVCIDRAYGILLRTGQLPPAPEALSGQPLKIVFISILTQMQRSVGMGSIERLSAFVGNMAAVFPEAAFKFDVNEAIDEAAQVIGAPPKMIRPTKDAKEMAAQAAEAQQRQQMMEAAPAMRDGAEAARLLSETDDGSGESMLQRVMGGMGQ